MTNTRPVPDDRIQLVNSIEIDAVECYIESLGYDIQLLENNFVFFRERGFTSEVLDEEFKIARTTKKSLQNQIESAEDELMYRYLRISYRQICYIKSVNEHRLRHLKHTLSPQMLRAEYEDTEAQKKRLERHNRDGIFDDAGPMNLAIDFLEGGP